MSEKFHAAFEKRNGDIRVFCVQQSNGNRTYLGTFDDAEECEYEGKYVFCLAAEYIARDGELMHIPVNVLREIADYGAGTKVGEAEYLDPFTGTWKKVEDPPL